MKKGEWYIYKAIKSGRHKPILYQSCYRCAMLTKGADKSKIYLATGQFISRASEVFTLIPLTVARWENENT